MVNKFLGEDYWESFEIQAEDTEFLYNHLLEQETPLTSQELVTALVGENIRRQKLALEKQRTSGGDLYQPKGVYITNQKLIFPAFGWKRGVVGEVRNGRNPELGAFQVIQVILEDGGKREVAAGLAEHKLNAPPKMEDEQPKLEFQRVLELYQDDLVDILEEELSTNPDFVRIAGRWFPRALLVDINIGHLNLAEAVLDMAGGGPLSTQALLDQIGLTSDINPKLLDFSLDLALQEDERFDEVGPAGDVLWYLRRLEPPEVLEPPAVLRYQGIEYDRSLLSKEMQALEQELDDELSPLSGKYQHMSEGEVRLIYPHWRAGTLPMASRIRHLFPTAYEAPRVRFFLVDGVSGAKFPGWVVREKRYVYGLKDWYRSHGLMPGSLVKVRKGENPGEVIVQVEGRRQNKEWVRTVLVGSDGGIVYALLKQPVQTSYDERMAIAIPDEEALDQAWMRSQKEAAPFEKILVNAVRELSRLNPQGHVHANELYAALNIVRRSPPAPILALLAARPWFTHVGDMHYRLSEDDAE